MRFLDSDLRRAGRELVRRPAFSVPALATLALASGVGMALLALVHQGLRTLDAPATAAPESSLWMFDWSSAALAVGQVQAESLATLLRIVGAATVLAILLGAVNLAVLLLARAAAREHEVSLRVVLGAGPVRLTRQLFAESVLLGLLGLVLGIVVAGLGLIALQVSWPDGLPARWTGAPTAAAAAIAAGVPGLAVLLFGSIPIRTAFRPGLQRTLTVGARATPGPSEGLLRRWLVTGAMAASVSLLVGAVLLLRAFVLVDTARAHDLGYDPADTLTMKIELAGAGAADPASRLAVQAEVHERLGGVPGVSAVSVSASDGPWTGMGVLDRVRAQCGDCVRGAMWLPITSGMTRHHVVGPGHFAALGIEVLRGREFGWSDGPDGGRVAVISRDFSYRIFLGRDPIGRPVQVGGPDGEWYTVVGVVQDVRAPGLGSGSEPVPSLYLSTLQHPPAALALAVRTEAAPLQRAGALAAALRDVHPGLVASEVRTMEEHLERFQAPLRWFAWIVAALAVFAAAIAAVGLFGVVAYTVGRRTREIGVRAALGARPNHVVRMVLAESLRLGGLGAGLGLLGALSLARLLQVQFLGVRPLDVTSYAVVAGLLFVISVIASVVPARRAASVDPVIALRAD